MSATASESQAFIVSHDSAGHAALRLTGDFDHSNADQFAEIIGYLVASSDRGVVIDLSGVTFMDSGGLHVLFTATREHRGFVRVTATSAAVDRLLDVTDTRNRIMGVPHGSRVDDDIALPPDSETALARSNGR